MEEECERWFIAKEISSEKKKVQWIECLLEDNADDVYEMTPVDEEKEFWPLATIWKSLEQRFDVPESVLEHLHKFQQFKRKETQSIKEYFVQLVAKANKAFLGASAAEIGKHVVDTFALNVSDTKLTAKVIAHRDTLTLEQLGKLVLEKEQARSLASTIGVDVKTEPSENLRGKSVAVWLWGLGPSREGGHEEKQLKHWGHVLGRDSSEQSRWRRCQFVRLPVFFTICNG